MVWYSADFFRRLDELRWKAMDSEFSHTNSALSSQLLAWGQPVEPPAVKKYPVFMSTPDTPLTYDEGRHFEDTLEINIKGLPAGTFQLSITAYYPTHDHTRADIWIKLATDQAELMIAMDESGWQNSRLETKNSLVSRVDWGDNAFDPIIKVAKQLTSVLPS